MTFTYPPELLPIADEDDDAEVIIMDGQMSEIVKRVAERISDELKLHKQGLDWEDVDGPIQRAARAAIEAMREPTEEMVTDGWVMLPHEHNPEHVWHAMIDSALKPS